MRTTTLALLSGAAMSISAASIYNVTPAGGFADGEVHASLEPLAPRSWPRLEPAGQASASGFVPFASTSIAPTSAPTASPFAEELAAASTAVALAEAPPLRPQSTGQFAAVKPPSTKIGSGWRARPPKAIDAPAFTQRAEPQEQRIVVVQKPRQNASPKAPPQISMAPMSTSQSFQNAPPASSFAAPASTSSARAMSTSR